MYYDADITTNKIEGKKITILGCGSQGHAHSRNLQDSGADVVVGLRSGSSSWAKAEKAGLTVKEVDEACAWGDIIVVLLPDTVQKAVYEKSIAPNLTAGKSLVFAHGFNIRFGRIQPPADVDVWMVAPKSPGHRVRTTYTEGFGVPSLIAVEQDATGDAKDLALEYAKLIGSGRVGILETSFTEETETDLFGEQAVLCGGCEELVKTGFEVLVEAGYQPEIAYFECLHELKLIVDLMYEGGIAAMNYSVSHTAEYGGYVSGPRVITPETKENMKAILADVQSGAFADQFVTEMEENGGADLEARRNAYGEHTLEKTGEKLRSMMKIDKAGSGDDCFNASNDA